MVAFGYNGTMRGSDNTCEVSSPTGILTTKQSVIHAEQNVICHAARRGVSIDCGTAFVTHFPCMKCATLLYQAGVHTTYYDIEYGQVAEVFEELNGKMTFIKRIVNG